MARRKVDWLQSIERQIRAVTLEQLAMIEPKDEPCENCIVVGELPPRLRALYFIIRQHVGCVEKLAASDGGTIETMAKINHHRAEIKLLSEIFDISLRNLFPGIDDASIFRVKARWQVIYHNMREAHQALYEVLRRQPATAS